MKECTFDRLDALISLGARSLVDKEAARFMQLSEDIEVSSRNRRRVEQTIRHRQNKEKMQNIIRPMKVAGIACLISVSLTFTACVSIPSVRVAMWNAIVEWYDEYISIRFVPGEGTDKLPEVPQTIEAINFPTYMPDGYSSMIMKTKNSVLVEYFDCDGEYAYSFTQRLYDNKYLDIDETDQNLCKIDIDGNTGVLAVNDDIMSVMWGDGKYLYLLQGTFESQDEMLHICRSVKHPLN